MDPITIGLIAGALLGAVKGKNDEGKANAQRKVEAVKARFSPWTGMKPDQVQGGDMFGSMMQGGMGGAMLGQGIGAAKAASAAAPAASGTFATQSGAYPTMISQQNPYAMNQNSWFGLQPQQ